VDQQAIATTARPSVGTRATVIALTLAVGISLGWALNSSIHHASRLPRHEVVGVVSRVDSDGLCITPDAGSSIQCGSTLLFGTHPPVAAVGDHVHAYFFNLPADQPSSNSGLVSVSVWTDVTPTRS
jgi:hypothetical protein